MPARPATRHRVHDGDFPFHPLGWKGFFCLLIYGNFFSNHYMPDLRWPLAAAILCTHGRSAVHFTLISTERRMPLCLSFLLIGLFIWLAENFATYFGSWVYPSQMRAWAIVGPHKITSWMLLVIISFLIVAALKRTFHPHHIPAPPRSSPAKFQPRQVPARRLFRRRKPVAKVGG